jgi:hypothetical protein
LRTSRGEQRLRVFEDRVLRKAFGPNGKKGQETGEKYITKSFMTCTSHQILLG